MSEKTKKLSGFAKGLIIYAAVFILIAAVLLGLLYGFCSAYENSRPYNSIESYLGSIDKDSLPDACEKVISELDTNICPAEESRSLLAELLQNADYVKAVQLCSPERLAYNIKTEDTPLGTIYLEKSDNSSFGFSVWEPVEEVYDLSPIVKTTNYDLPEGYSVSVNGFKLGRENIKYKNLSYQTLLLCYEYYDTLPTLRRFESGKYIGEAEVEFFDADGNRVAEENLNESYYLNNCTDEQEKLLKDFSDEVIRRYVLLCANIDHNEVGNYMHMKEIIVPESQLHDRMRISFYALGYSSIRSCEIVSTDMNICCDLGNGKYFTDLSYAVETWGLADPVTTEQNIQLIISYDALNQLKAEAMFNY